MIRLAEVFFWFMIIFLSGLVTFDGAFDRTFEGAFDRPFDGASDRTFDRAVDPTFDWVFDGVGWERTTGSTMCWPSFTIA